MSSSNNRLKVPIPLHRRSEHRRSGGVSLAMRKQPTVVRRKNKLRLYK